MLYNSDQILQIVNEEVKRIKYKGEPKSLFDPIEYILSLGGKRIRPVLTLMACNLYKDDVEDAKAIAMAIEVFHNFTLLHDDLMDKAEVRRGQLTVHKKWNDNAAILSGDAMMIEAYKEATRSKKDCLNEVLTLFSQTATEICCGQQLDMEFEERLDVTIDEYIEMIRLKTAVLIGCALEEGAIIGGASKEDGRLLYNFGINIGLAFQLQDDLLDVYGDSSTFGKKIGGDILCNKKTFLLINALQDQESRLELEAWISKTSFNETEKIKVVTNIYNRLNLKEVSENVMLEYYNKGLAFFDKLNVASDRKKELYKLAEELMFRNS